MQDAALLAADDPEAGLGVLSALPKHSRALLLLDHTPSPLPGDVSSKHCLQQHLPMAAPQSCSSADQPVDQAHGRDGVDMQTISDVSGSAPE